MVFQVGLLSNQYYKSCNTDLISTEREFNKMMSLRVLKIFWGKVAVFDRGTKAIK